MTWILKALIGVVFTAVAPGRPRGNGLRAKGLYILCGYVGQRTHWNACKQAPVRACASSRETSSFTQCIGGVVANPTITPSPSRDARTIVLIILSQCHHQTVILMPTSSPNQHHSVLFIIVFFATPCGCGRRVIGESPGR